MKYSPHILHQPLAKSVSDPEVTNTPSAATIINSLTDKVKFNTGTDLISHKSYL